MIERTLSSHIRKLARKFPVLAITGPRQSGKTTLVKHIFPKLAYVSLEDLDVRTFAEEDPRGFLRKYTHGAIFDEVQRVPKLFSYLQGYVDSRSSGQPFVLTGSQNFLLHEKLTQTLAGRVALLKLLPLSFQELAPTLDAMVPFEDVMFRGFYPRIYDKNLKPSEWYPSYVQTYIERDVRQIKNITDLITFQKFMKLCAGRAGQLLNYSSLATDCGITHNTAKSWISLLEASFIVFLLQPHHKNWNKRLVKMPKLYFFDTGLACSLLGIEEKKQLGTHYLFGNLFENFIIAELFKERLHSGKEPHYYFWRDKSGHEIDCLKEEAGILKPIEIKAGRTIRPEAYKNLEYWNRLSKSDPRNGFVVYGGDEDQKRSVAHVVSWRRLADI